MQFQRTIAESISIEGIGVHGGNKTKIILHPSRNETGISFLRNGKHIKAIAQNASSTPLCTTLSSEGECIRTIEHLMAAITCCGIDNLVVECFEDEVPIMDGSALPFIMLIEQAGIVQQSSFKKFIAVNKSVLVEHEDKWARFDPHYTTSYDVCIDFNHPKIGKSRFQFEKGQGSFKRDVAKARTFGFIDDLEKLQSQNLALGGSLHNAVVLDKYNVLNEEGLRYEDEFVRHKLLDSVGDLRLLGYEFIGKFSSYKSGHTLNSYLCKTLLNSNCYSIIDDRPTISFDYSTVSYIQNR